MEWYDSDPKNLNQIHLSLNISDPKIKNAIDPSHFFENLRRVQLQYLGLPNVAIIILSSLILLQLVAAASNKSMHGKD